MFVLNVFSKDTTVEEMPDSSIKPATFRLPVGTRISLLSKVSQLLLIQNQFTLSGPPICLLILNEIFLSKFSVVSLNLAKVTEYHSEGSGKGIYCNRIPDTVDAFQIFCAVT